MTEQSKIRWIQVALLLLTAAVFWPVRSFDFVNFDDPHLVSENPAVRAGLTVRGLWWGLTTSYFEFWHPLTWWSHMLDHELFGPRPGPHHLMSLAIHIATTLILFATLRTLTGALWRSAVVAALFALHPTHVESVAWLAERKDLLCGAFFLLTLWAYARYSHEEAAPAPAQAHSPRFFTWYRLSLIFFALALMSKPMAVTLPFVLLLLDFWPLQRLQPSNLHRAVLEKVPFFILTFASCAITLLAVKKADNIVSTETFPWSLRLANVPVSYARYIGKLFWPDDLIVLYRMPASWPASQVAAAIVLVLLVTAVALYLARAHRYVLVGWLFFLGMLIPTIGLVPVGFQSMADRYTYIPYVGLFIVVVWAVTDLTKRLPGRSVYLATAAVLAIAACAAVARFQLQHWRNSFTLWSHCLNVDPHHAIAHYNLGHFLHHSGRPDEARPHYEESLRLKPDHVDANMNLGVLYAGLGQVRDATNLFAKALRINPGYDKALVNMGLELYKLKDFPGATNYLEQAVRISPNDPLTCRVYGAALVELGDFAGALDRARVAIQLSPTDFVSLTTLGRAASGLGQSNEALTLYSEALRVNPEYGETHRYLGIEHFKRGEMDAAIASLRKAIELDAQSAEAHFELGVVLAASRNPSDAIVNYRKALQLNPNLPNALNNLAWMLATHPDDKFRNGPEAVALAERACEQSSHKQPIFIGTLAAAHAEAGNFDEAIATADKACHLALSNGQTNVWEINQKLQQQYRLRKPYRETH